MERKFPVRNFRKFGYSSRDCVLFRKIRKLLFHSLLEISGNSNQNFSSNVKRPINKKKISLQYVIYFLAHFHADDARPKTKLQNFMEQSKYVLLRVFFFNLFPVCLVILLKDRSFLPFLNRIGLQEFLFLQNPVLFQYHVTVYHSKE